MGQKSRLLTEPQIAQYLDVSSERTYKGKGCSVTTINVYPLLKAAREETLKQVGEWLDKINEDNPNWDVYIYRIQQLTIRLKSGQMPGESK